MNDVYYYDLDFYTLYFCCRWAAIASSHCANRVTVEYTPSIFFLHNTRADVAAQQHHSAQPISLHTLIFSIILRSLLDISRPLFQSQYSNAAHHPRPDVDLGAHCTEGAVHPQIQPQTPPAA